MRMSDFGSKGGTSMFMFHFGLLLTLGAGVNGLVSQRESAVLFSTVLSFKELILKQPLSLCLFYLLWLLTESTTP